MAAARSLAKRQRWTDRPARAQTPVLTLVEGAATELAAVYRVLVTDAREDIPVAPAAEWLLDNYYLIEEQITLVTEDLPARYGAELPRLVEGSFAEYPRLMEAVATLVAHTDSRIDEETLTSFMHAYQDVSPLTIGEVWAVPIMLRAMLVENLRRLGARILESHQAVVGGERFADRLVMAADQGPSELAERIAELDRAHAAAPPAFLLRLSQRLLGHEAGLEPLADWIERALEQHGADLERLTMEEHQHQAADQVSIANAITSIRFLDALEWREFFESVSVVEQVLREDPTGVYGRMDFASRDRLRHTIEKLAERGDLDEVGVAEAVISHCLEALAADPADTLRGHVGYYLISDGRYAFERSVGYRPQLGERLHRGPLAARGLIYWGVLTAVTAALASAIGLFVASATGSAGAGVLLGVLAVIPVSEVGMTLVNRLSAWLWPPRMLAKIDHRLPVAQAHNTMVVYTALLTSPAAAQHVVDNMEIGFLANRDPNVRFAILADLRGGSAQYTETDSTVIEAARSGIAVLNERYGHGNERPFSLFVRGRTWSAADETWMGWERKRGALTEFCRLLRGATDTSFTIADGDPAEYAKVTFVITLDTDTGLPRDGARKLISTIAHPLNRAVVDPSTRTVRRGYGLIQPRVAMSLEGSEDSLFAWLYSGVTGVDPYAGAVSDTYQDVFGEGSFTGKGIFEVDVFNAVLEDRFPENTLLSHDLLEGSYLRTGLASDIEVYDDQPSSYISHCARLHRWVRGDWQTLPWLLPRVPTADGRERNPLTRLHRWKIIDNLRRSLTPLATVALTIAGFVVLPPLSWAWLAIIAALLLFPLVFGLADSFLRRTPADTRTERGTLLSDIRRDVLRTLFNIAVLPHQTYLMTDAALRALWRMFVSRRDMLEWETAAEAERRLGAGTLASFTHRMGTASALAVVSAAPIMLTGGPSAVIPYIPLLGAWAYAPLAAWRASRPIPAPTPELSAADVTMMRRAARKTWRFFETFVTAEDHYLAPDNFQEDPKCEVAHRTSPTNMGLQLLAAVTAYDLGYLTVAQLTENVSLTLTTMVGMERFRGHFYNWYDTTTLLPLRPTYVSTVDSGNLAGHLLALRVALLEVSERPILGAQVLDGIGDTARLALEELAATRGPADT
ncbi:MAG: hypothetical protein AAGU73_04070, partial [Actinomycetota bacterium]